MSFKLFRNSRAARKHLSNVYVNLQAVDKFIKPCYLWDAFVADDVEIQNYLKELHSLGLLELNLKSFAINGTIFVTHYENLKRHLAVFNSENVHVVDVSKTKSLPCILSGVEKSKALKPVMEKIRYLLTELYNSCSIFDNMNVDTSICNLTTLFGTLLGYPILYWYKCQSPESDFACLSMLPLTVYKVTVCNLGDNEGNHDHHEIFSFSSPEDISDEAACVVQNWFRDLSSKCKVSGLTEMELAQSTVILPSVSM